MSRESRGNLAEPAVAVVPEMGSWSASTRTRALQHLPRLRERLARVDVLLPADAVVRRPGRIGQVRYFSEHARRYGQRLAQLQRVVPDYDALLVQRGAYLLGPGLVVRPVERFGGRVVLDLDDAVFEIRPPFDRKGAAARWLWGPQQTLRLLGRADAVIVSTRALAEMLPGDAPEPIVLPTVPDPAAYRLARHRSAGPAAIGWTGSIEGLRYLEPLAGLFERLRRERVAELTVVSSQPWPGAARCRTWREDEATTLFADFDIGIMPLADTPYARAKAGFKLLEYMAAGLPVVASPIGVNAELVEISGAGRLAGSGAEWEEALRELAGSVELRRELGARGRAFVESYADLDAQADVLARVLQG
jgi:glycosyltransferase involved in cell wall biosynthesis